jgi:hypothetical protein
VRGCAYARELTDSTTVGNHSIVDIASLIPQNEISVLPLDRVIHRSALGSTDRPVTTYSVNKGMSGNQILLNSVTGPTGPATTTPLVYTSLLPGFYTVPAGGLSFDFVADTAAITKCGTWDYEFNVQDASNDLNNYVRHRFEVGLKDVSVSPSDLWVFNDLGAPYTQTKTYRVTNVEPTQSDLYINAGTYSPSTPVLTINGTGGINMHLAPGESQDFEVEANQFNDGSTTIGTVYHAFVGINQLDNVCGKPPIFLDVDFKRGEQEFASPTPQTVLPAPTNGNTYGAPVHFDFDLSNEGNFCVGDINLDLGLTDALHQNRSSNIRIQVTAPNGRTGTLWAGNIAPDYPSPYWVDRDGDGNFETFHLDDSGSPPLGPQHLSYFNGVHISGLWHVDVSSNSFLVFGGPAHLDFTRGLCSGPGL